MAKEKSILDKFTETMKGLADSASQALKADEPARADDTSAAYMPFAAEGLVSDPLPVRGRTPRSKRGAGRKTATRAAAKPATKRARKSTAKKSSAKKPARKPAQRSVAAKSSRPAKTAKRKTASKKARAGKTPRNPRR